MPATFEAARFALWLDEMQYPTHSAACNRFNQEGREALCDPSAFLRVIKCPNTIGHQHPNEDRSAELMCFLSTFAHKGGFELKVLSTAFLSGLHNCGRYTVRPH